MQYVVAFLFISALRSASFVTKPAVKSILTKLSSTASAQFAQARAEAARALREEEAQRKYHAHLNKLGEGEAETGTVSDPSRWLKYAANGMTISENGCDMSEYKQGNGKNAIFSSSAGPLDGDALRETLDYRGFTVVDADAMKV